MRTPIDPPKPKKNKDRKISGSDFSESVGSPMRRYSVAEPLLPPTGDVERDFFSHLYSGDMTALEGSSVPEDYYNYLESWYRAQKGNVYYISLMLHSIIELKKRIKNIQVDILHLFRSSSN